MNILWLVENWVPSSIVTSYVNKLSVEEGIDQASWRTVFGSKVKRSFCWNCPGMITQEHTRFKINVFVLGRNIWLPTCLHTLSSKYNWIRMHVLWVLSVLRLGVPVLYCPFPGCISRCVDFYKEYQLRVCFCFSKCEDHWKHMNSFKNNLLCLHRLKWIWLQHGHRLFTFFEPPCFPVGQWNSLLPSVAIGSDGRTIIVPL